MGLQTRCEQWGNARQMTGLMGKSLRESEAQLNHRVAALFRGRCFCTSVDRFFAVGANNLLSSCRFVFRIHCVVRLEQQQLNAQAAIVERNRLLGFER